MESREYQDKARAYLVERTRACVVSPAGSGKTIIMAGAINDLLAANPAITDAKVGWTANTVEQVQQARAAMAMFPLTCNLQHFTAACYAAGTDWSGYDLLVVDECHHLTAPELFKQVNTCLGIVWGCTATPYFENDSERNARFREFWGHQIHTIGRDKVASKLTPAYVRILPQTDMGLEQRIDQKTERDLARRIRYWKKEEQAHWNARLRSSDPRVREEAAARLKDIRMELWGQIVFLNIAELGIEKNKARNQAALTAALGHTEPTLVLVGRVEHAKWFEENLPNSVACYAAMGKKKREQAFADFRSGAVKRLIATSLFDEGADVPCIEVLVLVSGGRSEIKTVQRTGRVIRKSEGKTHATIYDFADKFHPLAEKHSARRLEIYKKLNYIIT